MKQGWLELVAGLRGVSRELSNTRGDSSLGRGKRRSLSSDLIDASSVLKCITVQAMMTRRGSPVQGSVA